MPNGGTITLRCTRLDEGVEPVGFVRFSVTDDGEGMPAEVAEKAFEPFFTTKEVGKGTGLGLSMVHGFAVQSGGNATLESKLGQGSRIMIDLPVASTLQTDENSRTSLDLDSLFSETILVVEDEPRVLNYLRLLLEDMGMTVFEARSASQALDLLPGLPALDLLLSDVIMPGRMSGYELAREVRRRCPGTRIVLMSGYKDLSMIEKLHAHEPLFPLLRKPFSRNQLAEVLISVLGR